MNKFFLLSFVESPFNTRETLKQVKSIENYRTWNVQSTETIGDRGLVLKMKTEVFDGYILITKNFSDVFFIRTINKCGMVLKVNKTDNVMDLIHIVRN